jgi:hypothetical protein
MRIEESSLLSRIHFPPALTARARHIGNTRNKILKAKNVYNASKLRGNSNKVRAKKVSAVVPMVLTHINISGRHLRDFNDLMNHLNALSKNELRNALRAN